MALALGAQSSVITQIAGIPGLSYTAVSSPVIAGPWGPWGPWAPSVAVAAPVVGAGPGTYVAQTRGAVHTAPLDGHLSSVANVNLAPAPGTI